jgi:uncharacterized membrane protein
MDAIAHITKFSMAGYHNVILVLLPFGLGINAGLIPASKLLSRMFKRFPIGSYFAILVFVLASIPVIFVKFFQVYGSNPSTTATLQIILGFISLRIGFVLSYFLSKLKMNNKEDNELDGNTIVVEEKEIQQEQVEEIEENKSNIIKDEQP